MSIEAVGYVLAQWDYATICMKIRGRGPTGPLAKEQTLTPSQRAHEVLDLFDITAQKKKTTFSLKEEVSYNRDLDEREVIGYRATNHITIYVDDLSKVGELQDALTSIEGLEVEAPSLRISPSKKTEYQERALTEAWEKVQRRWLHECKVLGRDPVDYFPGNFNTYYDRNNRDDVGGEVSSVDDVLQFNAGAALVSVKLSCNFYKAKRHKPSPGPYADNSPCYCVDCGMLTKSALRPEWEDNACSR